MGLFSAIGKIMDAFNGVGGTRVGQDGQPVGSNQPGGGYVDKVAAHFDEIKTMGGSRDNHLISSRMSSQDMQSAIGAASNLVGQGAQSRGGANVGDVQSGSARAAVSQGKSQGGGIGG